MAAGDRLVAQLGLTIVAHAGSGQASATPITAMQAQITTSATIGDSCVLPPAKQGMEITVVNNGAQSANVFAASAGQGGQGGGDTMNGSANGSAAVAAGTVLLFFCFVNGAWVTK